MKIISTTLTTDLLIFNRVKTVVKSCLDELNIQTDDYDLSELINLRTLKKIKIKNEYLKLRRSGEKVEFITCKLGEMYDLKPKTIEAIVTNRR